MVVGLEAVVIPLFAIGEIIESKWNNWWVRSGSFVNVVDREVLQDKAGLATLNRLPTGHNVGLNSSRSEKTDYI